MTCAALPCLADDTFTCYHSGIRIKHTCIPIVTQVNPGSMQRFLSVLGSSRNIHIDLAMPKTFFGALLYMHVVVNHRISLSLGIIHGRVR